MLWKTPYNIIAKAKRPPLADSLAPIYLSKVLVWPNSVNSQSPGFWPAHFARVLHLPHKQQITSFTQTLSAIDMSFLRWIRNITGADMVKEPEQSYTRESETDLDPRWVMVIDDGFEIVNSNSVLVKKSWSDITDCELAENKVILHIRGHSDIEIPNSYFEWYNFIQCIPPGFKSFDYQQVEDFMNKLTGCFVCGLMSVYQDECLYCKHKVWQPFNSGYPSREDYIRDSQLNHFLPFDGDELNLSNSPQDGFQSDPNWICLVTPDDFENRHTT